MPVDISAASAAERRTASCDPGGASIASAGSMRCARATTESLVTLLKLHLLHAVTGQRYHAQTVQQLSGTCHPEPVREFQRTRLAA